MTARRYWMYLALFSLGVYPATYWISLLIGSFVGLNALAAAISEGAVWSMMMRAVPTAAVSFVIVAAARQIARPWKYIPLAVGIHFFILTCAVILYSTMDAASFPWLMLYEAPKAVFTCGVAFLALATIYQRLEHEA
jgi:hypothetical protein